MGRIGVSFDSATRFDLEQWALFRTYAALSLTPAAIAARHRDGVTAASVGSTWRAIRAELVRRAEREERANDARLLRENPRRLTAARRERYLAVAKRYWSLPSRKVGGQDHPRLWMEPKLAAALAVAGLTTLRSVAEAINRRGVRWHSDIGGVGQERGRQIARWIEEHAAPIGVPIERYGVEPRTPAAISQWKEAVVTDAVTDAPAPLERFKPRPDLDGSRGRNRGPSDRCQIAAAHDLSAIAVWLHQYQGSPHTWRAYRKEAERFLAWSVLVRGKPISSLGPDDCAAYRDFLTSPKLDPAWVGKPVPRWHKDWRPFIRPLSSRSAFHAITVLRRMCAWLAEVGYLLANPWAAVNTKSLRADAGPNLGSLDTNRAFDHDQIETLWSLCDQWEQSAMGDGLATLARQRFAFTFCYLTGARLAELAALRIGAVKFRVRIRQGRTAEQWWVEIKGKGGKVRTVPLPDEAVAEYKRYMAFRGLPFDPRTTDPMLPLVPALPRPWQRATGDDENTGVSPGTVYRLLKQFFSRAAKALDGLDSITVERLKRASTHWLRHSYGSHADAAGVTLETIRRNMGHASLQTTSAYVHAEDDRRWDESQKLARRREQQPDAAPLH